MHVSRAPRRICTLLGQVTRSCAKAWPGTHFADQHYLCHCPASPQVTLKDTCWDKQSLSPKLLSKASRIFSYFENYKINISSPFLPPHVLAVHMIMSLEREREARKEREKRASASSPFLPSRWHQVSNEPSVFGAFDLPEGLQQASARLLREAARPRDALWK